MSGKNFTILRTGNEQLDRVQDNIKQVLSGMQSANQGGLTEKQNRLIKVVTKTGPYALTAQDDLVLADASSFGFSLSLPDAIKFAGKVFRIKKIDSSTNAVSIVAGAGQTIDGVSSKSLSMQNMLISVVSNGSNWFVLELYPLATNTTVDPTVTLSAGWGTPSLAQFYRWRVADRLYMDCWFEAQAQAATIATISLPTGLSIDSSKLNKNRPSPNGTRVGTWTRVFNGAALLYCQNNLWGPLFYDGADNTNLYFTNQTGGQGMNKNNVADIAQATDAFSIQFNVPIVGWGV